MKIYRGPKSKGRYDDSHEHVAEVSGKQLKESVKYDSYIEFNVTKNGKERQAICTANFDVDDISDMVGGMALRCKIHDKLFQKIQKTVADSSLTSDQKIENIKNYIIHRYFQWG